MLFRSHRILVDQGKDLLEWPGIAFKADSENGKVLLGCPNGFGVGFMLAQHKVQLGNKTVGSIRVFGDSTKHLNLLFEIEDVG